MVKQGDEVYVVNPNGTKKYFLVTLVDGGIAHVIDRRGVAENDYFVRTLRPTGRHFKGLKELIARIGETHDGI